MPDGFSNNNPQKSQKNVLGGVLQTCSMDPVTGFTEMVAVKLTIVITACILFVPK